jgi:hypothetical protein
MRLHEKYQNMNLFWSPFNRENDKSKDVTLLLPWLYEDQALRPAQLKLLYAH